MLHKPFSHIIKNVSPVISRPLEDFPRESNSLLKLSHRMWIPKKISRSTSPSMKSPSWIQESNIKTVPITLLGVYSSFRNRLWFLLENFYQKYQEKPVWDKSAPKIEDELQLQQFFILLGYFGFFYELNLLKSYVINTVIPLSKAKQSCSEEGVYFWLILWKVIQKRIE